MSYQTIKRTLGETSLERKCRLLFGVCLLVLITASFYWYGSVTEDLLYQQNRLTARRLVDQVLLREHWVKMDSRVQPEFAELVKTLGERLTKHPYQAGFIYPRNVPGKPPPRDELEFGLLDKFSQGRPADLPADEPEFADHTASDKSQYYYYQAVRADQRLCLNCHQQAPSDTPGVPPLMQGDLLAVVRITLPNQLTQRDLNWNRAILVATAIVTVFLAMMAAYVIVRYVIVKPLRHLRDVADAISHGNIAQRADIHTGDEFEALAHAFNRMLRHLVTIQEELRQVNASLDAKVDELAQVNMRLYEMNRIKSDFLATMSHELRTPLNSILGFSDVLQSIDSLEDKQKRYVQNIQRSGRVLLDMINNILDLAKIESGKMDVRLTDFRVEQVVAAQCDMARPLTEKKNIDLECLIEPDLPPLRQDQARLQQVLNNLLSNAIKFTPEGGKIKVVARRDQNEHFVMQVVDTGVGIAEEDQQTIFEKFRQGSSGQPSGDVTTREYSGTGLGLSIVKELCRLLGGEVAVESVLG